MASFVVFDNKTAKSIIQEVCAKQKLQVLWDSQELQKIPPVFKATCNILGATENGNNLTAEGLGSTKKDSDQVAAYRMFPKIFTTGELLTMMAADKAILQEETRVKISLNTGRILSSPRASIEAQEDGSQLSDDSEITGDPIGDLITLCRRSKLQEPKFLPVEQRIGPGNVPIFTVTCFVGDLSTCAGKGAKKQDAKKLAAFRVLRELKLKGYKADDKKSKNTLGLTLPPSPRVNEEVSSSQESEFERSSSITIQTGNDGDADAEAASESPQPQASMSSPLPPVKRATAAVAAAEAKVDMDKETDHAELTAKLKRKLEEEEEKLVLVPVSSSPLIKRKYEMFRGIRFICENQSENCLRFIKDFAHVFLHLPPNATLEEALIPREFQLLLDSHGGALRLLEKYAKELNAKLYFSNPLLSQKPGSESESGPLSPINSRGSQTFITFLTMIFPFKDFKLNNQQKLVLIGEGKTLLKAKENAALEGLKLLRTMLISDDIEE